MTVAISHHYLWSPVYLYSEQRSNSYSTVSSCATWQPSTTVRTQQRPQLGLQLKQLHELLMELKLQLLELLMEQLGLPSRSRGFSPEPKPSLLVCLSPRFDQIDHLVYNLHSSRPAHPSPSLPSSSLQPPPWPRRASKTRLLFQLQLSSKASDHQACTRPACLTRPRRRLC